MIIMCQCMFISFSLGDVDFGEAVHVCELGIYGNSVPSVEFWCEPKTSQKRDQVSYLGGRSWVRGSKRLTELGYEREIESLSK